MTSKFSSIFYGKKEYIIGLLLLALTAFYCILPLFIHQGLPYAHDIIFHIFQADQFDRSIHEGFFYPRWVPDFNNGYGSPSFVFYSPLGYYLVSAVRLFTPSLTIAMIAAIWLGFFLSGVTMFVTTNKMFGGAGSVLPAVIYQILPFHLWDIYIRGTLAEFFAFIWFPLIILFMQKTIESRNKMAIVGLSLSYAGLILTHLVSGFIFSLVIAACFIYSYFRLRDKKPLIRTLCSLGLGLGLSAVYLLPVVFERKFVQIEYIVTCPVGNYKKNFLFTWDKVQTVLRNFYLPVHIGVLLEVALFIFVVLLMRKNKERLSNGQPLNFFVFLFFAAFFLTTPLSRPIWDIAPGFPFLQFPWRWIPMMDLALCFLLGFLFSFGYMSSLGSVKLKRIVIYFLIALSLISFVTISQSRVIPDTSISKFLHPEQIKNLMDPPMEYAPIWAGNIKKIMSEAKNEKVSVISGTALTDIVEWKSEKRVININASTSSLIRIATFYYPGWEAYIDNMRTEIKIEKGVGAMLIDIPEGRHIVVLKFEDTPLRYYAKIISLISFCVVVLLALFIRKTTQESVTMTNTII